MPLSGDAFGDVDILGDLTSVRSLAIDFRKELLYWTESSDFTNSIFASRLDGEV